jgi:hypothetical protein
MSFFEMRDENNDKRSYLDKSCPDAPIDKSN